MNPTRVKALIFHHSSELLHLSDRKAWASNPGMELCHPLLFLIRFNRAIGRSVARASHLHTSRASYRDDPHWNRKTPYNAPIPDAGRYR